MINMRSAWGGHKVAVRCERTKASIADRNPAYSITAALRMQTIIAVPGSLPTQRTM
jgi:hypothetical protein